MLSPVFEVKIYHKIIMREHTQSKNNNANIKQRTRDFLNLSYIETFYEMRKLFLSSVDSDVESLLKDVILLLNLIDN